MRRALGFCLIFALAGCASGPRFDTSGIDNSETPSSVVQHIDAVRGHSVLWGGVILAGVNLKDATQLEVLAYPLDSSQRPDLDAAPTGRFLVVKDGYLETADYATGRVITVMGSLRDTRTGQVGQASYTYPVIVPQGLYLWPSAYRFAGPSTQLGIGISIEH